MTDEPIEPDAIPPADAGPEFPDLGIVIDPSLNRSDQSWITDMGFEVTRPSPPVGAVAAGFVGVGFDLMVPDEEGRLQLAEAYDAEGNSVARSVLSGAKVPESLSEAVRDHGGHHDDTFSAESTPTEDGTSADQ